MWPAQTFNEPMGYYGNSLDYQSNLMNGGNPNLYSNHTGPVMKLEARSPSSLIAHSPISEDESSLKRKRKGQRNTRKVIIEKKRRDRINMSLDELRKLVPAANEKQGSAKLEKAEILQMTVDHLKALSAKGFDTFTFDPHSFATKHLVNGFKECADQVTRFLTSEGFGFNDQNLKVRLITHLQHYIAKREYDLKACNVNGLSWNPNLFLMPPATTAANHSTPSSNGTSSLVNTTTQQMLNSTTNLSPITTLTPSSLSSHSNSSITSNSSSYHQQVSQQNDSTPTSPLSESPVANSSLNGNSLNVSSLNGTSLNGSSSLNSSQLTASQLLSQHSYTDNNNNTSSSSSAGNNPLHSDAANNSAANQSSNAITDDSGRNSLLSNIMGPPPPLLQKVNVLNGISPHSPNSASELTYTNMHPSPNANAYSTHHHHHHSVATNGYPTNPYAAAIAAQHSNHIHHHAPYNAYSALAYGTSVGQMSASASMVANVVSLPNSSVGQTTASQSYSNTTKPSLCRPWGPEMAKMAY